MIMINNALYKRINKITLDNINDSISDYISDESKTINIKDSFDFRSYIEILRIELSTYSKVFNKLYVNADKEELIYLRKDFELKKYIEELLSNDDYLESFAIYKIQQFINSLMREIRQNNIFESVEMISKKQKYLLVDNKRIDVSNYVGFVDERKMLDYLYNQFGLESIINQDYEKEFDLTKKDDLEDLLFKAGLSSNAKGEMIFEHPVKDNKTVMNNIKRGLVANKKHSKIKELLI